MQHSTPTPNRLLDLTELDTAEYQAVLEQLDRLVAGDAISYLHPGKRWEYPWALQRAELKSGLRVLDAGCGDSIFPVYLASLGCAVTAVDLDFATNLGSLHGVATDYVRGDLTRIPLKEEYYDRVFCISVIEHLSERRIPVAMEELRRVLRPGGKLLLTTDYYENAKAELWYRGPDRAPFRVDWEIFDADRLRTYILAAPGFRLEGELDLTADWGRIRREMQEYHGYPYTSVGVALVRE